MPAGTAEGNLKSPASQSLVHVSVSARAIDHQKRLDCIAPLWRGKQVAHAAQIAFAFLANVADKNDVGGKLECGALQERGHGQQSSYTGGIVTDARAIEAAAFFTGLKRGTVREYRIQVRAHADQRRGRLARKQPDHVAQFVHMDVFKAKRSKSCTQPLAARGLAKRRRRDLSELTLPAAKLHLLIVQISKSGMHASHLRDARNLALRRGTRGVRNRWAACHLFE